MKANRILTGCAVAALLVATRVVAQDKPKPEGKGPIPLKISVVFSEYEGEKKISSLPYVVLLNASSSGHFTNLRMGIKVPILVEDNKTQYQNVGTDIDCRAMPADGGKFTVDVTARRSSIYSPEKGMKPIEKDAGDQPLAARPIFREFNSNLELQMIDGQTIETTMATDPVSGRVLKIIVSMSVVK